MSYENLMRDIKRLPEGQYDLVVKIVEALLGNTSADMEESKSIADRTNLSDSRRRFLDTAGKIDIDEEAVEDLRKRSMI